MAMTLLKWYISKNKEDTRKLAEALDITPQSLYFKMNGQREFKANEMKIIKERYKIPDEDFIEIFFN